MNTNTPVAKGWRTFIQGALSILVHLPFIILIPDVRALLDRAPAIVGLTVVALAGVIAYFQNKKGL